jgi:hypothetical protein
MRIAPPAKHARHAMPNGNKQANPMDGMDTATICKRFNGYCFNHVSVLGGRRIFIASPGYGLICAGWKD